MKPAELNEFSNVLFPMGRFSCRAVAFVSIATILAYAVGCTFNGSSIMDSSEQAEQTLVAALVAWKEGRPHSLAKRDPAIRFVDDDQRSGLQLVDYEITHEPAEIRPFQNVAIRLSLKDRQGRILEKSVTYQVGVEPKLTVLRSDN